MSRTVHLHGYFVILNVLLQTLSTLAPSILSMFSAPIMPMVLKPVETQRERSAAYGSHCAVPALLMF